MNQIINQNKGDITIEDMMSLCGSHRDPLSNSNKIFGNTLSVITTVKSVVFDPSNFTLYVSNRNKTPVGIGNFLEINERSFITEETLRVVDNHKLNYSEEFLKDLEIYRKSYMAGQMKGNYLNAFNELKEISGAEQVDPHINIQCGYLALKLGESAKA